MNRTERCLTALFCAASFTAFGVAHAQVGESSGVPYLVNCSTALTQGTKVSVALTVEGPNSILQIFTLPWVDTVPLIAFGSSDGHQAYSNNNVFLFVPSGGRITILPVNAKGLSVLNSVCALTGYDVPSPGLKVGGTGD